MANVSHMQLHVPHLVEEVYNALTSPDAMRQWQAAEHANVDLPNGIYQFWGNFTPEAPQEPRQKLLAAETNRLLKFQWTVLDGEDTIVTMLLGEHNGRTILDLRHDTTAMKDNVPRDYNFFDFWLVHLENLRRYLDGKPIADTRTDYSDESTAAIRHEIDIDAAPDRIFQVLTDPQEMEKWIASSGTFTGDEISYGWEGVGTIKILELQPNRQLKHSWFGTSVVTWTLSEHDGKTRLTFVHSGFDDDRKRDERTGWLNFLSWIRAIAEYGDQWRTIVIDIPAGWHSVYSKSMNEAEADMIELT